MKIPNNISTVLIIILLSGTMYLKGQLTGQSLQNNYFVFDSIEWKRILGRYERVQTRADVILRSGAEICGQIVLIDSSKMILYPG